MHIKIYAFTLLCILTLGFARGELTISQDHEPQAVIVVSNDATSGETQAAKELSSYLNKITGGKFKTISESEYSDGAAIFVGQTSAAKKSGIDFSKLGQEQWLIKADDRGLILTGGRPRGTLYAVFHFLEDDLGVHWWNPYEEFVPQKSNIVLKKIDRSGQPAFSYRGIYYTYGGHPYDRWDGQFSARNRINAAGSEKIALKYGGDVRFGPPAMAHTLHKYLGNIDKIFKEHPEWFAEVNGKRIKDSQLCLTNPELRKHFITQLRKYILESRELAKKQNRSVPMYFPIDQVDGGGIPWCECEECKKIVDREKSVSGLMIDFLNSISAGIKKDFPEIKIVTLAYLASEEPPHSIKPADNIIVRLTDTRSNMVQNITAPDNKTFYNKLEKWSKIASQLMIWDYAVNYTKFNGDKAPINMCAYSFPFPSSRTYKTDYEEMLKCNVKGVFIEHEFEISSDMRDMKMWLEGKLMEDPSLDDSELTKQFIDGYYGPAAKYINDYLVLLEKSADETSSFISWIANPGDFRYLTVDFLQQAETLFDNAEASVKDDPVFLRRVRHARMAVDSAILICWPKLVNKWKSKFGDKPFIFDRDVIAKRFLDTWKTQCDLRMAGGATRKEGQEFVRLAMQMKDHPLPKRFKNIPADKIYDFTAKDIVNHPFSYPSRLVSDADAETGFAQKADLSKLKDFPKAQIAWYKFPLTFGIYDKLRQTTRLVHPLKKSDIKGPGYHWYKLGSFTFSPTSYAFFYGSWEIQLPLSKIVSPGKSTANCQFWVNMKFEGPEFPYGKKNQKNAIYIQRIVLIKS